MALVALIAIYALLALLFPLALLLGLLVILHLCWRALSPRSSCCGYCGAKAK